MDDKLLRFSFRNVGYIIVELREEWNPKTVDAILSNLPLMGRANRWGDEVYFSVGIRVKEENSRVDMEVGEVAYWPPGEALCIFFGPTPVSVDDKPRTYSPVNPIGFVREDLTVLSGIKGGEKVTVELVG